MGARNTAVEELGFWSSHPDAMRKSRRALFLIGMLPMVALLTLAIVVCSGFVSVKTLIQHPTFCAKVLAVVACAGFGAIFTLCLLAMLSTCKVRKGSSAKDRIPFPYWMIGLAAIAWLLPLLLSYFRNFIWDGPFLGLAEFVLKLLCFAPFFWICIWLGLVRGRSELPKNARHPVLPLVLGCLALVASCLPFFTDVRGGLVALFPHSSLVKSLHVALIRLFSFTLLFPIGMMFVCLWKMMWAEGKTRKKTGKKATTGDSVADESKDDGVTPDAVLVLQQEGFLPPGMHWTDPVVRRSLDELGEMAVDKSLEKYAVNCSTFSPLAEERCSERLLFGGHLPTVDQVSFLRDVRSLHDTRLRQRISGKPYGRSQDMFLFGHEGSGRTEALCAAAVQSALLRGENVVYFVAGNVEARSVLRRIRSIVDRLMLGEYVTSTILNRGDGYNWSNGKFDHPVPGILIAEPRDFECEFFSNSQINTPAALEGAADVLLALSTVIVDDFLEYSMPMRAHLTFIVKKLRLLQAGNCHPLQALVSSRPIARPEQLFDRFSPDLAQQTREEDDMRQNVHYMRPRDPGRFWCGTLTLDAEFELGKTVGALVSKCVESGRQVLFYSKHATESAIRSSLERSVVASGDVRFISKIDALSLIADKRAVPPDVVIYLTMTCAESSAALRLSLPTGEPVFVRIVCEGESSSKDGELFPLLPDEMAIALKMRHLRTLLPLLSPHMPILASDWADFGISVDGKVARLSELDDSAGLRGRIRWSYDRLEDGVFYSEKNIPPYLILETSLSSGIGDVGIDCDEFPDAAESLWHDASDPLDEKLFLAETDPEGASPCEHIVKWVHGNKFVGETDISHSDALRLQVGGVTYVRDSWKSFYEREPSGRLKVPEGFARAYSERDRARYCAEILANPCSGTEVDRWIPVKHFRWQVPDHDVRASELQSDPGRAAFFALADARDDFRAFRIQAAITGLANVLGQANELTELPYDFNAYLSCIIFSPIEDIVDKRREVGEFVNGAWRTDQSCGYSAALTLGLTAALRKRFGGFLFYSSLAAFLTEGRSGGVGDVVVWIIEPEDSGRAASSLLKRVISDEAELRRSIFEDALGLLRGLKPDELAVLRAAAQAAYVEDSLTEDDLSLAVAALEKVLSKEPPPKKAETSAVERPARRYSISYTPEEREFDDLIVAQIGAFAEEIDVSKFVRPKEEGGYSWTIPKMWDTFFDVLWNNPQLFYVSKRGRYQYWTRSDGTVTRAVLKDFCYGIDRSQYAQCKQELDATVALAMKKIDGVKDPVQKAKILHDHIIAVCDYDRVACENHDGSPAARTVYSVLVRGSAVCEGYCMAYRYLLNKAGIVSEEIESDSMNHCWNYVLLNGRWYHVDVTWDDSGGQNPASHAYFLLSDEAIRDRKGQKHYGWSTRGLPPASDTWYDCYDWDRVVDVDEKKRGVVEKKGTTTVAEDPLVTYRNHIAFRAQNRGCSLSCRGKIVIRVFFVDDSASAWDETAKDAFKRVVSSAAECLVNGAKDEGLKIEVMPAYSDKRVSCEVTSNGNSGQWIAEMFGMSYSSEMVADQNRFRRAIGCDESPIVFAFNKDFRSCASTSKSGAVGRRDDLEWSMVSYRPDDGVESVKRTLVHELLHQFGAIDLYYPKRVSEAADDYLKGSVMSSGAKIDDLTKVLIGWRTTLSPKAIKFLEATKDVTEKQISVALEQEWKKKWRG